MKGQLEIKMRPNLQPKQLNKLDLLIISKLGLNHSNCNLDIHWSICRFYIKVLGKCMEDIKCSFHSVVILPL